MYLNIDKPIEYLSSSHRHFFSGERHVARRANYSVLVLVYENTLRFGENGRQIEVKSGEYYIQRAGLAQDGAVPSDAAKYYFVHFNGSFDGEGGIPIRGTWSPEKIMPLFDGMEGRRESDQFYLQKSLSFYSVLSELYKSAEKKPDPLARQIMEYILSHYRERLAVSEIAKRFYISENYCILVFRRAFGITPYKYVSKLRLEKAVELLKNTTRSEEEIAFSLGFSDFSVFYKAFCTKYGHSPSTVRK